MSDETTAAPPAKKAAARKLSAAPPPEPAPSASLLTEDQQRRHFCLAVAKGLLDRDFTAGELIDLADYIETGLRSFSFTGEVGHDEGIDDGAEVLTFTGAPTMEGTSK